MIGLKSHYLVLLLYAILPNGGVCQRRIVGGTDATDGMFPFAAFVQIDDKGVCTGSLLTDSWVLTAAHCVVGAKPKLRVFAGSADRRSDQAQVRNVEEIKIHTSYVKNTLAAYDIALIKVEKPFNMSSPNIGTIPLSSDEWPQDKQLDVKCTALGWGRMSTKGNLPDVLQYISVVAKHGDRGCPCAKRFEQKKLVCLEGGSGKGPCMGDSGGPLICDGKEIGITHMGFTKQLCNPIYPEVPKMGCGQEDTVVAYMYLCPHLDWLKLHVTQVPATPASCSAVISSPSSLMFIFLTFSFVLVVFLLNVFEI